jgi:hydroxymethylglutaryl-CoA reductase
MPGTLVGTVAPLYGSATNGVDSMVVVVTNLSTAVTFSSAQYATAASGGTITVTSILTPSGGSPLASMKAGRIRCYFKKL